LLDSIAAENAARRSFISFIRWASSCMSISQRVRPLLRPAILWSASSCVSASCALERWLIFVRIWWGGSCQLVWSTCFLGTREELKVRVWYHCKLAVRKAVQVTVDDADGRAISGGEAGYRRLDSGLSLRTWAASGKVGIGGRHFQIVGGRRVCWELRVKRGVVARCRLTELGGLIVGEWERGGGG